MNELSRLKIRKADALAKWRNLNRRERADLFGIIAHPDGSSRNGRAEVWLRPETCATIANELMAETLSSLPEVDR